MNFTNEIYAFVLSLYRFFTDAWVEVQGWVWPFFILAGPLYNIANVFWQLLSPIAAVGEWVTSVVSSVNQILSSVDILALLDTWLTYAANSWAWVSNWWNNVLQAINLWWVGVSSTVQGWIALAFQAAETLVNQVEASLGDLRTEWDNFWTLTWPALLADLQGMVTEWGTFLSNILPTLANWSGINDLINSTLLSWFPFYDELVSLWGGIQDMFSDPEDYLLRKLETMLERFW